MQPVDSLGQVLIGNTVIPGANANLVRLEKYIGMAVACRWFKAIRGEFNQKPQRIAKVNRVHEASVLLARVRNTHRIQPRRQL